MPTESHSSLDITPGYRILSVQKIEVRGWFVFGGPFPFLKRYWQVIVGGILAPWLNLKKKFLSFRSDFSLSGA